MHPLVSCLMLTYNRYELFKKSFRAFAHQTYPNTQMIIVDSGDEEYQNKVDSYVKKFPEKNIKHIKVEKSSIGVLRNHFFEHADGDYFIVWDDDDVHSNSRITKQVDICLKSNIDGTILRNFIAIYDNIEHKCTILHGLEGTLLFRNPKGMVKYNDKNLGEDTDLVKSLKGSGQMIAIIDEPYDLYKYNYHDTNTVGGDHFTKMIEDNRGLRN